MNTDKLREWEDRFDKQIEKVTNLYYGNGDGYDEAGEWVRSEENKLFIRHVFPESFYELDPDKVKDFIRYALQEQEAGHLKRIKSLEEVLLIQARQHKEELEEIVKEIETIDFKEKHICRFNDGTQNCECYLQGLEDALSIICSHIK